MLAPLVSDAAVAPQAPARAALDPEPADATGSDASCTDSEPEAVPGAAQRALVVRRASSDGEQQPPNVARPPRAWQQLPVNKAAPTLTKPDHFTVSDAELDRSAATHALLRPLPQLPIRAAVPSILWPPPCAGAQPGSAGAHERRRAARGAALPDLPARRWRDRIPQPWYRAAPVVHRHVPSCAGLGHVARLACRRHTAAACARPQSTCLAWTSTRL